jgi:hypothetical protein
MKKLITTFLITLFVSHQAYSAQIIFSNASYKNKRFYVNIEAQINSSPKLIFAILTNYNNLSNISPKIIESKIIKKEGEDFIVKTVIKGCILFFCKKITNVQRTAQILEKSITAITIPPKSNLKYGKMTWQIEENKKGVKLKYLAQIEPDFFIPPIVGEYFIKKAMLKEAQNLIRNMDNLEN